MTRAVVHIASSRLGTIRVPEADLLRFPGLPGFPGARRFALVEHDHRGIFGWLVSADLPELAFVVTNPWNFVPDYDPAVPERALRGLDAQSLDELEVLAIAAFEGDRIFLNLAAPLLVNPKSRSALQVILDGDTWSTRQPIPPPSPTGEGEPAEGAGDADVRPESGGGST